MPSNPATSRTSFPSDERAEVGVGTLIVFIAMVLVAAVAAAVIIGTSGDLQQRAATTGQEATEEVSSNFQIVSINGIRNNTGEDVWNLTVKLQMSAGASDMDLRDLVIRWSNGTASRIYKYDVAPIFSVTFIRGSASDSVIEQGDLVELGLTGVDGRFAARSEMEVMFIPQVGSPVPVHVRMPATFGAKTIIPIR